MHQSVREYVDAIPAETRPLFDRVHGLLLEVCLDAEVVLSYTMPTYVVGDRRLHVGAWKHGLSFYGWDADHDGGFVARHPELSNGKGTLRLSRAAAAEISDEELKGLVRGALMPQT